MNFLTNKAIYSDTFKCFSHESSNSDSALVQTILSSNGSKTTLHMDNFPEHRIRRWTGPSSCKSHSFNLIYIRSRKEEVTHNISACKSCSVYKIKYCTRNTQRNISGKCLAHTVTVDCKFTHELKLVYKRNSICFCVARVSVFAKQAK